MNHHHIMDAVNTASANSLKMINGAALFAVVLSSVVTIVSPATTRAPTPARDITQICAISPNMLIYNCSSSGVSNLAAVLSTAVTPGSATHLDLSSNSIVAINSGVFKNWTSLTTLYLQANAISVLDDNALDGLTALLELHLQGNALSTFNSTVFTHTPNLVHLQLGYNNLGTIAANAFQPLTNLQYLNLEYNQINSIEAPVSSPASAFHGLFSLQSLNLAGNLLSYLQVSTFKGLSRGNVSVLQHLNLSSIGLTTLYNTAGPLSANTTPDVFLINLNNLQSLDISNNQLSAISSSMTQQLKQHIPSISSLDISDNPIHCDCTIGEFLAWINSLTFSSANTMPLCNSPPELASVSLLNASLVSFIITNCSSTVAFPPATSGYSSTTTKDPNISSHDPLPYDAMMGWYTAIFLGSLLVLFLLGMLLDKLKRKYYNQLRNKLYKIEKRERMEIRLKFIEKATLRANTEQTHEPVNIDKTNITNNSHNNNNQISDSQTMPTNKLCSIAVNSNCSNDGVAIDDIEQATDALETALGVPVDILNHDIRIRNTSVGSNTSDNMRLAQENARRNILLCDARATADNSGNLNNMTDTKGDKSATAMDAQLELFAGVPILEVNPECPLHGTKFNAVKSNGAVPTVQKTVAKQQPPPRPSNPPIRRSYPTAGEHNMETTPLYPTLTQQPNNTGQGAVPKRKYFASANSNTDSTAVVTTGRSNAATEEHTTKL